MALPLEGVRILDSAYMYPGPYCSMLLADLGADVLKVERPGFGDPGRQDPFFFQSVNRNKKSLALNLKAQSGKEILHRLVENYDVFMEGFRPGVAARIGIDYDTLRKINPRIVYCSISGFGQQGPYKDMPNHDVNLQALSGMLYCLNNAEGDPIAPRIAVGDLSSAMFATVGIMAALMAREKTGLGEYIDVSMLDGLISWMSGHLSRFFGTGRFDRSRDAGYAIFRAGDGKPFALGIAYEDWFWDKLCSSIGLEEYMGIGTMERKERREELVETLQSVFSGKPLETWMSILSEADVPISPVNDLEQVTKDEHVRFREMFQEISLQSGERGKMVSFPVKFSKTPTEIRMPPPELGEHSEEVLLETGYTSDEIGKFKKDGVI
ncbi:CaiB/BaiF CoA transferase family protein [Thermodesulfobacteriota bacterium]